MKNELEPKEALKQFLQQNPEMVPGIAYLIVEIGSAINQGLIDQMSHYDILMRTLKTNSVIAEVLSELYPKEQK